MIRYPASRIFPGPEDVNYHLNRVLMRQAARHQAYSPDEPPTDDNDTENDRSVSSSPSLESGSGSGYESTGSSWPESQQDQDQDQQSEGGSSGGSSVIHRAPKHIHASRYLPRYQQQPRRFTLGAPSPKTHLRLLPAASTSASASTSDSQVASLRILFETLSLNSLPSYPYPGIVPVQSMSQADTNTDPRVDNPQSDMTMEDAPSTATTRDARDAREPAVVNRGESTSEPTRRPRKIQKPNRPTGQTTRATLPNTSGQAQTQGSHTRTRPATTTTETLTSALTPDQWTHMMDASRAFHSHVQQMLAELDDEYDSEDEFGMRELRRRPAAAAAAASGRGSTSPN